MLEFTGPKAVRFRAAGRATGWGGIMNRNNGLNGPLLFVQQPTSSIGVTLVLQPHFRKHAAPPKPKIAEPLIDVLSAAVAMDATVSLASDR